MNKSMIKNKQVKNSEIKIRTTKDDKNTIQRLADKECNGNISQYILQKCLYETEENQYFLTQQVETWNYINELQRLIMDNGSDEMKQTLAEMENAYRQSQHKKEEATS